MAAPSVSSNRSTNEIEIFTYAHEQMVKALIRFIITAGLPLDFGAQPSVMQFINNLNPCYGNVSLRTVVKTAMKEFKTLKMALQSEIASLSHNVALACDVWRNENCLNYIRVTAHWIDDDWDMQRRIINFMMLDDFHACSIYNPIMNTMNVWKIRNKTFSITIDDVCDYTEAKEDLTKVVHPILDGKLFCVRCVCRILNSCVEDGLRAVSGHVTKIRDGIGLPVHNLESYTNLCEKYGLNTRCCPFDDGVNWDSTLKMLKNSITYKGVLTEYIALQWPGDKSLEITEQDWEVAAAYCRILDVFHEAVDFVSANYYPTSSGVLLHLVNIAKLFSECRGSDLYKEKIQVMEERFLKHYEKIPDLFSLAAVMDPRIKLSGCESLLESFYQCTNNTNVKVEDEKLRTSNLLHEMYNLYASRPSKRSSSSSGTSSSTSGFAWSLVSKSQQKTTDVNELMFYLQSPRENEIEFFDILEWWKNREIFFPVLATMARDLLTTPVSTLAEDCAFDMNPDKEIRDKSYHLRGKILQIYTCLKDWFNAEWRRQGERDPVDEESDYEDYEAVLNHEDQRRNSNVQG